MMMGGARLGFAVLKEKEMRLYDEYQASRLVLVAWDGQKKTSLTKVDYNYLIVSKAKISKRFSHATRVLKKGRQKMVVNVNYDDVKTQITDLIEAAIRGDKVMITKNGQQIIQLVPVKKTHRRRKFGIAKGKIKFASDFDAPLADFSEYIQ